MSVGVASGIARWCVFADRGQILSVRWMILTRRQRLEGSQVD